jgi:hypothetical protein
VHATIALGDVGGYREGSAEQLISHFESARLQQLVREGVGGSCQFNRQLPDIQVSVAV